MQSRKYGTCDVPLSSDVFQDECFGAMVSGRGAEVDSRVLPELVNAISFETVVHNSDN